MPPEEPPPISRIPDLNRFERKLLGAVIIGALGVGGLGLYSSYHAVSNAAANWGFKPAFILPLGLDVSIPVFSLGYLLLIRFDMELAWVRFVSWALTAVTVYLNIVAAGDNRAAQVGHGALPLLWVICSEIAAHVYRVLIGAATGRRMERVRKSRWILAPLSTFVLWRRMVLWEVTSYRTGLALERERRMIRAGYRQEHGRGWRRKVTRQQLAALRLGELAPAKKQATATATATIQPATSAVAKTPRRHRQMYRTGMALAGAPGTPAWDVASGGRWIGPHAPVIYFIVVDDKVKIGFTHHLEQRLKELSLPLEKLALVLHGRIQTERRLHRQFAAYRLNYSLDRLGTYEWFSVAGELADFLAGHGVPVDLLATEGNRAKETVGKPSPVNGSAVEAIDSTSNTVDSAPPVTSDPPTPGGRERKRRPIEEWVELAGPIFHAEFNRRRRQPTGDEFALAIKTAGYGAVSASTAKNIRTAILDAQGKTLTTR